MPWKWKHIVILSNIYFPGFLRFFFITLFTQIVKEIDKLNNL